MGDPLRLTEGKMSEGRAKGGKRQMDPFVLGKKGASLFIMIPLERWNVERKDTFQQQKRRSDDMWHPFSLRTD